MLLNVFNVYSAHFMGFLPPLRFFTYFITYTGTGKSSAYCCKFELFRKKNTNMKFFLKIYLNFYFVIDMYCTGTVHFQ